MPPRRGRGRGKAATPVKKDSAAAEEQNESVLDTSTDAEMAEAPATNGGEAQDASADEPMEVQPENDVKPEQNGDAEVEPASKEDETYPYQIKVSHMPDIYSNADFQKYLASTFKVVVPKVVSPAVNNPWVMLCFNDKKAQEGLVTVLHSHVWRKKTLRAVPWLPLENRKRKREDGGEDQEQKKNKPEDEPEAILTMEEEILSESLPLLNVSYEEQKPKRKQLTTLKPWMTQGIMIELEKTKKLWARWKINPLSKGKREAYKTQRNLSSKLIKQSKDIWECESEWNIDLARFDNNENRLSRQDAELMAQRLHGLLCEKNPLLAGWAEKSSDDNDGNLFKIEPLKVCTAIHGYRNKCKFRIGKNTDGETTVGFCLNDNESKILAVEPGDKFIHLPDSMKYAAKKFQDFIRSTGKEAYDKKKKTGTWDNLLVRVAPDGALMLAAIVSTGGLSDAELAKIKDDLKAFYTTGDGKDCNVFSLYLQVLQDHQPIHPLEKLELLSGKPDYEENICGLKFYVSPFSILNINPSSSENIYNSVIELAEPTPEHVVIDVCAGSCGIAFTFAAKVEKAYAIEPQEENVRDALKTKAINNITNVEIIKGKCEDHLGPLFDKLKDKQLIVVLDPPRHGVVAKIIAQIRAQPNVQKVVYVCSNTKTGVKNFLDFCAKEGRDASSGQTMAGLPFLPIRGIPIDVAPYTVNNTVPLLLERVDPCSFPPAKKPPPAPIKREFPKKKLSQAKRRKNDVMGPGIGRGGLRGVRGGGVRGPRVVRGGPPGRFPPGPPFMRPPMRPLMSGPRGRMPPNMPPGGPAGANGRFMDTNVLINKYERRIAELEQQDRAFKAGLTMGLQAINRGGGAAGGPSVPRNMGDYATGEAFGGYRGGYKDPYGENSTPWQGSPPASRTPFGAHATAGFAGNSPFGGNTSFGGNSPFGNSSFGSRSSGGFPDDFGPPMSGGGSYGSHAAFGAQNRPRPTPLVGSRFVGMSDNRSSGLGYGNNSGGGAGFGNRSGGIGGARGNNRGGVGGGRGNNRGGPNRSGGRGGPVGGRGGQAGRSRGGGVGGGRGGGRGARR